MSKILIINNCEECPFFNAKLIHYSDNTYNAVCNHPIRDEPLVIEQKCHSSPNPDNMACPLTENNL